MQASRLLGGEEAEEEGEEDEDEEEDEQDEEGAEQSGEGVDAYARRCSRDAAETQPRRSHDCSARRDCRRLAREALARRGGAAEGGGGGGGGGGEASGLEKPLTIDIMQGQGGEARGDVGGGVVRAASLHSARPLHRRSR